VDSAGDLDRDGRAVPRVGVVIGTRPEAIKLAPLVDVLEGRRDVEPVVVSTGQQRDLLDAMLSELGIRPARQLRPDVHAGSLAGTAGSILCGLAAVLPQLNLAALLVHGDTATSTMAALAAFYGGLPVIHVEAGLRSGDRRSPYPEEINRRLTTVTADLHLAPTARAQRQLLLEGVPEEAIVVTGNTVVDAVGRWSSVDPLEFSDPRLAALRDEPRRVILATMHRRESWGEPLDRVVSAISHLARRRDDIVVVAPVHPNPIVRRSLLRLAGITNVVLTAPLPYHEFLALLAGSELVITDSGGVQEEAPSFGVPVLVLRDKTEREEGLATGHARLVGTDEAEIVESVEQLLDGPSSRPSMVNPYGDGLGSQRCAEAIASFLAARGRASDHGRNGQAAPTVLTMRSSSGGATTFS
jgi:UDP-N-acetylglucosamine 2-epimerase (non-hydrolysing)